MKIVLILALALGVTGCMSGSGRIDAEPNYVESQLTQSPLPPGDQYGRDDLPPRVGLPE
jgi:hypothetical protein